MARSVQISVSAETATSILAQLDGIKGILGTARHHNASISPPGDIVTIHTTNEAVRDVLDRLSALGVPGQGSILTSELNSIICPTHQKHVENESNETVWEEMAVMLRQETNIDANYIALTFFAGAIAAIGLWADKIHVVIGAMVIAPAFEPLLRIPFGLIAGPRAMASNGLRSCIAGYFMMLLGGAIALLILRAIDPSAIGGTDLEARSWVQYWSTFSPPGVLASFLGAAAGAFVVSGLRSVLTTGVMITLSLVPSITLVGMALANANAGLAMDALIRWSVDVALVLIMSAVVLGFKQKLVHRRRALG